jgi:hypothetical protein
MTPMSTTLPSHVVELAGAIAAQAQALADGKIAVPAAAAALILDNAKTLAAWLPVQA